MNLPVAKSQGKDITPAQALKLLFEDYKPNTRRAYVRIFNDFQAWASIDSLEDLQGLNTLTIMEYKHFLKSQGKKAASINQTMSGLRKVFKVLTEFEYLPSNPFKSTLIRNEKVSDVSTKGALGVANLNAMIQANERENYDHRMLELIRRRNGLILRFLYFTAARRSEVAELRWDDLQQDSGFQIALIRNTKSGVPQRLKIRAELYAELQDWRYALINAAIDSPSVFVSLGFRTQGQKMTGKGINDVVVRLGKAVGLKISAHYLRHTAITLALEMGEPLQKVQAYARHSSANTTIRYYHDQELLRKNPTDSLPRI